MVKEVDCGIVVSEFVLQPGYYVHFRERHEPPYPPSYRLNSINGVLLQRLSIDCGIVVSEFELQSRYYVHFRINTLRERYEHPYPPSYGLNSINSVLLQRLSIDCGIIISEFEFQSHSTTIVLLGEWIWH